MSDHAAAHGASTGRLSHGRSLRLFAGGFLLLSAILSALGAALAPGPVKPVCKQGLPCGKPPQVARPLLGGALYRSAELGYQFEFSPNIWHVQHQDGRSVTLVNRLGELTVAGLPRSDASPAQMLSAKVDELRSRVPDLSEDTSPADEIFGANVGFHPGPGALYVGTLDAPQGKQGPVSVALMAATDGRISVLVTLATSASNTEKNVCSVPDRACLYQVTDLTLETLRWPADPATA